MQLLKTEEIWKSPLLPPFFSSHSIYFLSQAHQLPIQNGFDPPISFHFATTILKPPAPLSGYTQPLTGLLSTPALLQVTLLRALKVIFLEGHPGHATPSNVFSLPSDRNIRSRSHAKVLPHLALLTLFLDQ